MSAAMIESPNATNRIGSETRTRQLRPGRGAGRGVRPVSRSSAGVAAPTLGTPRQLRTGVRGCASESRYRPRTVVVGEAASAGWRLTNRGIAVVMIVAAVLAAAAITVITATAITVTSEDYHPHGSALSQP
jgi:hypothetical protein